MTFDDQIASRTLWQECRGEPIEGQKAVAAVLLNRVKDGRWGKTLAEVCLSEYKGIYQFSGWARSDPNRIKAMRLSDVDPELLAVYAILDQQRRSTDFTGGAMWYYAVSMPKAPIWTLGAKFCGQWGAQKFWRGVE